MHTSLCTKEQILEQARKENIPLSSFMFDKYVSWGLLRSSLRSKGYHGTEPATYAQAMDAIRLIHQLVKHRHITKKDTLFVLYWAGLPVRTPILMNKLYDYQQQFQARLITAVENIGSGSAFEESLKELIKEEIVSSFTTPRGGRPKKSDQERMNAEIEARKEAALKAELFLAGFKTLGYIAFPLIAKFVGNPKLQNTDMEEFLKQQAMFQLETWLQPTTFTRQNNEEILENVIQWIRSYAAALAAAPFLNSPTGQKIRELLSLPLFTANPAGCRLLIFLLMASGLAPMIVDYLSTPGRLQKWEDFCKQLNEQMVLKNQPKWQS